MSGGREEEPYLRREMEWLLAHNNIREYMMVLLTKKEAKKVIDDLDDDIPF
jgi:hypothetical protein